jgi:hypothetical protein
VVILAQSFTQVRYNCISPLQLHLAELSAVRHSFPGTAPMIGQFLANTTGPIISIIAYALHALRSR